MASRAVVSNKLGSGLISPDGCDLHNLIMPA